VDDATRELAAIAAAIAGKCRPCFAHHLMRARELGVGEDQIREAVELARNIRSSGDSQIDEFADGRMQGRVEGTE